MHEKNSHHDDTTAVTGGSCYCILIASLKDHPVFNKECPVVWGWRLPGDSHKQTRVGGGMRWPARIADCFGEVCLQVRPRAQVAMVAGTFPSTPRTCVVRERTASTTRTVAAASSPTSSGPRFMTWGARYSEQPRWPATTTVVRVNELRLKGTPGRTRADPVHWCFKERL